MNNSCVKFLSFFLICFLFIGKAVYGQDDFEEDNECVRTLKKAQKEYDDGRIESIENMIKPCLEGSELSKEEKLEGYKLLAMAKTYDGKEQEAEQAMLQFLKLDPEYEPQPGVDPKEFLELYNDYHTSPLYTLGFNFGPNWSFPQSYQEFGAYDTDADPKVYSNRVGFQIGLRGTRYIHKGLNVHLDATFSQNSFSYSHDVLESYTNVDPSGTKINSPTRGVTIESIESQTALILPISFSYTFLRDKTIRPYAFLGFETRLLLSASNSVTKTYFDQDIAAVDISDIENFKNERNGLIFSGLAGFGAKYKIKGGDIYAELKYNFGISDQVKRDEVDVNDDARLWNFYEQDNNFTLDNVYLNIGYNYYFYKPRKMKAAKNTKEPKEPKKSKEKKAKKVDKSDSNPTKQRQIIE